MLCEYKASKTESNNLATEWDSEFFSKTMYIDPAVEYKQNTTICLNENQTGEKSRFFLDET